jgi:aryl-alcohol dehydrogenase-like predicted oxidoreductase
MTKGSGAMVLEPSEIAPASSRDSAECYGRTHSYPWVGRLVRTRAAPCQLVLWSKCGQDREYGDLENERTPGTRGVRLRSPRGFEPRYRLERANLGALISAGCR